TLVVNGVATPETVDRTFMIANRGCQLGPCGMLDIVGMTTAYNISSYWGELSGDEQQLKNARYIKEYLLDRGKLGAQSGEGFYTYPNPSYAQADFLDVPDLSRVDELARLAVPD
ncbi:MAG: 3-hydroxyacyl-CoA dehydrogenase family protein, partial [Halieaceae bacterium]|nr:3-hydroxyacyl-CoA dehydrogenase family protein [Halieaceae bacterium]